MFEIVKYRIADYSRLTLAEYDNYTDAYADRCYLQQKDMESVYMVIRQGGKTKYDEMSRPS